MKHKVAHISSGVKIHSSPNSKAKVGQTVEAVGKGGGRGCIYKTEKIGRQPFCLKVQATGRAKRDVAPMIFARTPRRSKQSHTANKLERKGPTILEPSREEYGRCEKESSTKAARRTTCIREIPAQKVTRTREEHTKQIANARQTSMTNKRAITIKTQIKTKRSAPRAKNSEKSASNTVYRGAKRAKMQGKVPKRRIK